MRRNAVPKESRIQAALRTEIRHRERLALLTLSEPPVKGSTEKFYALFILSAVPFGEPGRFNPGFCQLPGRCPLLRTNPISWRYLRQRPDLRRTDRYRLLLGWRSYRRKAVRENQPRRATRLFL